MDRVQPPSSTAPDRIRSGLAPAWLLGGLGLGAADGALAVWSRPLLSGSGSDRLLTIGVAALTAAVVVALLRLPAWPPARLLGRRGRFSVRGWTDSLTVCALFGLLVLLALERRGAVIPPGDLARFSLVALAGLLPGAAAAAGLLVLTRRLPPVLERPGVRWGVLGLWIVSLSLVAVPDWRGVASGNEARADASSDRRVNLILISVDTLRADRLGAYGYERPTSPNLDRLAAEGVVFTNAYAAANGTLPSHSSILTGLDPLAHGAIDIGSRLAASHRTLAERLRSRGYHTVAWVGMGPRSFVGSWRQLDQGFDLYEHSRHPRRYSSGHLPHLFDRLYRRQLLGGVGEARPQIDSVLRWLRGGGRREPFLLFLHLYDVHSKFHRLPYEAPPPFRTRFCPDSSPEQVFDGCRPGGPCASRLLATMAAGRLEPLSSAELEIVECLYDGGVAFADHELGRLIAELDRSGLGARTVVVVTSDHGEAFFEHGAPLHTSLYDHTARVPLLVRGSGVAVGRRVDAVVEGVDLVPTLLELAGAPLDGTLQGSSLAPLLSPAPSAPEVGEAIIVASSHRLSIRVGRFKYVQVLPRATGAAGEEGVGVEELFDLAVDPGEQTNLADEPEYRPVVERLRIALKERRARSLALAERWHGKEGGNEPGAAEMRRLRALGYVE